MVSDLAVITVSTVLPGAPGTGTFALYAKQLDEAGIDYYHDIIPYDQIPNMAGGGTLGFKVAVYRRLATTFMHYDRIVISDAFDVTFWGTKAEVLENIPAGVLCAAERNCYPEREIADLIPGSTPWRFFNGGLIAADPSNLLLWLHLLEGHPEYEPNMLDQAFFNRLLARKSSLVTIDSNTNLFYCMWGEPDGWYLDFDKGHPVNTLLGTCPCFLHTNGHSDRAEVWAKRDRSLL
jgi:hypothetical protein